MNLLSARQQEEVLLSYQREYGALLTAYNKQKGALSPLALRGICEKVKGIVAEILHDTQPSRHIFNEESADFAKGMVQSMQAFLTHCLPMTYPTDTLVWVRLPERRL